MVKRTPFTKRNKGKRHCVAIPSLKSGGPSMRGCADLRLAKVPDGNLTLASLHRPLPPPERSVRFRAEHQPPGV